MRPLVALSGPIVFGGPGFYAIPKKTDFWKKSDYPVGEECLRRKLAPARFQLRHNARGNPAVKNKSLSVAVINHQRSINRAGNVFKPKCQTLQATVQ
jgi:hypothetical protein